jgi:hypothetical protein
MCETTGSRAGGAGHIFEGNAVEADSYLGELTAGIIYLLAGVRLLLLGVRTGETPERLLGANFVMFGISGVLYSVAVFEIVSAFETQVFFAARIAYLPGAVLLAVFTARVFRPDVRWAKWLVWSLVALMATGVGGSVARGDLEGFSLSNGWFWLEWVGYTLPFGWAAVEAFNQYLQARRRVSVGLCEPSVCNRMFLWSAFGAAQFVGCLFVLGQYAAYERENVFSSTWDLLYSGAALVALIVMWIAFFPPKFYLHWLNSGAAKIESASE